MQNKGIKDRLERMAATALQHAAMNPDNALHRFGKAVVQDAGLLAELVGIDLIKERAAAYLRLRLLDIQNQSGDGASQSLDDSQATSDRPAPTPQHSSRLSQRSHESQRRTDQSAAPDDTIGPKRRVAPSTKISSKAAAAVARSSVYDMRMGTEITFRTAKLFDVINAERAGSRYTHVMTMLRTRKAWPADATVPDVYSEAELKAMLKEANDSLPALPTEALVHAT